MSYMAGDPSASERNDVLAERELVLQAQQGDQQAFEALYERYYARISRYLIRLVGDNGAGCELAQETFLCAWEALSGLRDPSRFASWLYRIATNEAYTYQNHAQLLHTISWDEYVERSATLSLSGPESFLYEAELMKLVLARVSSTYRPYFILYVIEKCSQKEIADLLGVKPSIVSKYVSRGKEEFRQIYFRMTDEMQTRWSTNLMLS